MPRYEYFCDSKHSGGCGYEFEEQLPVAERMDPMCRPCPKCNKKDSICRKFTSHLFHGVVNPKKKMDENFKETMERIHSEHPDAQSSYF